MNDRYELAIIMGMVVAFAGFMYGGICSIYLGLLKIPYILDEEKKN